MRLARVRYLLKWNSFSSSVSCLLVKFVRPVLLKLAPGIPDRGPPVRQLTEPVVDEVYIEDPELMTELLPNSPTVGFDFGAGTC